MSEWPADLQEEINAVVAKAMMSELGKVDRRYALRSAFAGMGGLLSLSLLAESCKSVGDSATLASTPATAAAPQLPPSFLLHVKTSEAAVDADSQWGGKIPTAPTDPKFADWAKARGSAVGKVIGAWLTLNPYGMLQELLDQDKNKMPIFRPTVGPVIIFRHEHVIKCLDSSEAFTVAPYSREMKRVSEGEFDPSKFGHFILGTDQPELYEADSLILRSVLSPNDRPRLRLMIRRASMAWVDAAKQRNMSEIDIVQTLCRFVPITVCDEYLGFNVFQKGQFAFDGKRGGDSMPFPPELKNVFKFTKISNATVPTKEDLYLWIKDAFRNIFNNVARDPNFEALGITSTENQVAYVQYLLNHYRPLIKSGDKSVPDTMLTRLMRMQFDAASGKIAPQQFGLKTKEELLARLTDARIRENVIGTVSGAGVNPEEGMARVIDALLNLEDGKIPMADPNAL